MTVCVIGLVLLDGWLDGSLLNSVDNKPIQGSIFALLVLLTSLPAISEMKQLLKHTSVKMFDFIVYPAVILLGLGWYFCQFFVLKSGVDVEFKGFLLNYMTILLAFSVLGTFLVQGIKMAAENVIHNCGANILTIMYLGFLCSFVVGIRVSWGPMTLLMFIFTVKSSDIGAFTIGKIFGRHKLAPTISPGKTLEGLIGAILFAAVVSFGFCMMFGLINPFCGLFFGAWFGVLGRLGDLLESMLKRDAAQKDSSDHVPGFGGILDVIDSPLATAPLAYAFFAFVLG